jgi:hypothetical protein
MWAAMIMSWPASWPACSSPSSQASRSGPREPWSFIPKSEAVWVSSSTITLSGRVLIGAKA